MGQKRLLKQAKVLENPKLETELVKDNRIKREIKKMKQKTKKKKKKETKKRKTKKN